MFVCLLLDRLDLLVGLPQAFRGARRLKHIGGGTLAPEKVGFEGEALSGCVGREIEGDRGCPVRQPVSFVIDVSPAGVSGFPVDDVGAKKDACPAGLKPVFHAENLRFRILSALGADPGRGGARGGGVGDKGLRDHFPALGVHKTPGSAPKNLPLKLSAKIHRRQSLGKGQHLVIFGGDHELSPAVDKPPLPIGPCAATVLLKKINLLKTGRNDHFPGFGDKPPFPIPFDRGQPLAK